MSRPVLIATDHLKALSRSRDLIAARYDHPLTLHDVAHEACLSPFHFHRLFSAAFNQTPHQFLTEQRMERAKQLLAHSDMSVTEICFELGYSSLGSFSTLFQKKVGCSPVAYREGTARFYMLHRVWSHRFVPTCFLRSSRPTA